MGLILLFVLHCLCVLCTQVCVVNIDHGLVDVQIHEDVLLPKMMILHNNLTELIKQNQSIRSLDELRSSGSRDRPWISSGVPSICEHDRMFDRGMELVCHHDVEPQPSVRVRSRLQKTAWAQGKLILISIQRTNCVYSCYFSKKNMGLSQLNVLIRLFSRKVLSGI